MNYFFFFQAEDGIRDYKVTGVQTCALPISIVTVTAEFPARAGVEIRAHRARQRARSEERRVGKGVDLGGRRIIKKKKKKKKNMRETTTRKKIRTKPRTNMS